MVLDISGIIEEKMKEMEQDGSIRDYIRNCVETTVKDSLERAIGGYRLKDTIQKEIEANFPEIVKDIGLDGYNGFIAETVRKTCIAQMEGEAQAKISKAIEAAVLMKRDKITLSEILKAYRDEANDNDDVEWKRDMNEDHDGYTCAVRSRKSTFSSSDWTYYTLWFNAEGYIEEQALGSNYEDCDLVVILSGLWEGHKNEVRINDIYFAGEKVSKQFIHHAPSGFESLLLNLYMNKTPIIMDLEKYDEEDHYYEVEGD